MPAGRVQDLQILVAVVFHLPNQPAFALKFVVDTGFAGALTLPPNVVAKLGLLYFTEINANLADDSNTKTDVYIATIVWNGREQEVAVLALGSRPLLGTALLAGKHLGADFIDDGIASIEDV